ncbi:MAG: extracellular solute-binding protein [Microthrixaceae bacterium]
MSRTATNPPTATRASTRSRWLLAALAVLALLGAACSGSDESANDNQGPTEPAEESPIDATNCPVDALAEATGQTEITVWHAYNSLTQKTLEQAAIDFNASQDEVEVSVEAQGTYPELLKKYEETLATPDALPDVVFSEDTTLQFMVDSGSVIAADDCIAADPSTEEFYDDLLAPIRSSYVAQGKLWAAAYGVSMPIMYINNDHLEAAGLSTTAYPGTLAELRETSERIKAANIEGLEAPMAMMLYGWYPENWLTGAEQLIVNKDNGREGTATRSEFDNETTLEIVEWLDSMQSDGLLKAYPYGNDISQFLALGNGSSSILIDGSRAITAINAVVGGDAALEGVEGAEDIDTDELAGLDVNVAPVPGVKAPGKGGVWGSAAFLVNGADEAKVAAGWEFLKYFNSTPVQTQWLTQGSYLPVTQEVQDSPEVQSYFDGSWPGRWLSTANQQLLSLDPDFPGPAIGPYNEFRAGLHSLLDSVVLGSAEPRSAIAAFDEEFQGDLDDYLTEVGN